MRKWNKREKNPEADPRNVAAQVAGEMAAKDAGDMEADVAAANLAAAGAAIGVDAKEGGSIITPRKMQAIEAELSSVVSGMMTSVVSNILTQEPKIIRRMKRQSKRKTEL